MLADFRRAALIAAFDDSEIVCTDSLDKARSLCAAEAFDLAVIDLHLGPSLEETGIAFIGELHKQQPRCRIIGFSVHYDNQGGVRAMVNGASDYISGRWKTIPWFDLLVQTLQMERELISRLRNPVVSQP
jgi:DNA-binding NarL/FixJ family response regulator